MTDPELRSSDFLRAPVNLEGFGKKTLLEKGVDVFHMTINLPAYAVASLMAGYHAILRKLMGPVRNPPSQKSIFDE